MKTCEAVTWPRRRRQVLLIDMAYSHRMGVLWQAVLSGWRIQKAEFGIVCSAWRNAKGRMGNCHSQRVEAAAAGDLALLFWRGCEKAGVSPQQDAWGAVFLEEGNKYACSG